MTEPDWVQTQLLVVQATPYCNLDCRYCYLPDRQLRGRTSERVLSRLFEAFFESPFAGDELTLVWHAGEPLSVPISFYQRALELQDSHNRRGTVVTHSIQTNATLINERWCELFSRHRFDVGISIDGPAWLHDANRRDLHGRGTHARVMRGIRMLQEHGIPFTVIAVVSDLTLGHADEVYDFFAELRPLRLAFSPEMPTQISGASTLSAARHADRYRDFLARMAELNEQAEVPMRIREIEETMQHIVGSPDGTVRSQSATPFAILSVDSEGRISTFSPLLLTLDGPHGDRFTFGTVFDGPLAHVLTNPRFVEVAQQIGEGVRSCKKVCDYFDLCGGGYPCEKFVADGRFTGTETSACRIRVQAPVDAVLEHLEQKAGIAV